MHILAVDSGNTRIKWGYWDGHAWSRIGALTHDEAGGLADVFRALPAPQRIAISNVAGTGAAQCIRAACDGLAQTVWAVPCAAQCGVRNLYEDPGQLGADRWAALIGARSLHDGACLVVGAGTATTADLLSSRGEFHGGIIFPGVALMKRALAENTARLPMAEGALTPEPRNTADAIETGVMLAQVGAIERLHGQFAARQEQEPLCLLSGGAAARIASVLTLPHRLVDNLVLDGLVRIAEQPG